MSDDTKIARHVPLTVPLTAEQHRHLQDVLRALGKEGDTAALKGLLFGAVEVGIAAMQNTAVVQNALARYILLAQEPGEKTH